MNRHKIREGHNKRAIQDDQPRGSKSKKTKQRTINEMLQSQEERKDDEDDETGFFHQRQNDVFHGNLSMDAPPDF